MNIDKIVDILTDIESIPSGNGSRKRKLEILLDHADDSDFREFIDIAFNPYRVFGINKIPKKSSSTKTAMNFRGLVFELEKRTRGQHSNKIKQFARDVIDTYPKNQRPILEKALLKNLKIGIDVKTLNKAGYEIPTFDCLLAAPNKENSLKGTKFPCYSQAKLDGVRCVRFPGNIFLGRNGKVVPNTYIKEHIQIPAGWESQYVLDGEFFSFTRKFNEIVGLFQKDYQELPDDIKFVVFNAIPIKDWEAKKSNVPYHKQLETIDTIEMVSKNIQSISPFTYLTEDEEEVFDKFNQLLSKGFEGLMVRNTDSLYSWDRVDVEEGILTKIKPFDHADCIITGYYEGKDRNVGRLGGFILDYNGKEVRCGGGFSDEMREEFWKITPSLVGQ